MSPWEDSVLGDRKALLFFPFVAEANLWHCPHRWTVTSGQGLALWAAEGAS